LSKEKMFWKRNKIFLMALETKLSYKTTILKIANWREL